MVFGNISTLYFPVAANAGASQWGTDVRKLLDAVDAGADTTTINNHGTGGAVTRTFDPYSTSSADADQTLFGWAVTPADMGSVAGARRFYPAGDHVATFRMSQNGVTGVAVTVTVFVYRVGPSPGRTRTLLGSGSASPTLNGLSSPSTVNVTVALSEIVFEADETIQYSIETNVAGVAITGRNVVLRTGTDGGVGVRMDTPQLGVLKDFTGTADGTSTALGVMAQVLPTTGTATASGTGLGVLAATGQMGGTASGIGTALGVLSSVATMTGTTTGAGTALGVLGGVGGLVGDADGTSTVTGSLTAVGGTIGTALGLSDALAELTAVANMTGTAAGTSTALGVPSSLSGTVGDAFGFSDAEGILGAVVGTVGTVIIGGACPADWGINDGLKSITGIVFDHETGDVVAGATVCLVRDSDALQVGCVTSGIDGSYTFPRDTNDPNTYYTIVTSGSGQGRSEGGCAPT